MGKDRRWDFGNVGGRRGTRGGRGKGERWRISMGGKREKQEKITHKWLIFCNRSAKRRKPRKYGILKKDRETAMQDTGSGSFGPLCPTPSPRLLPAPLSRLNLPYSGNTWHTSSKTLLNWSPLCFLWGFTSTAVIVLWKLSTSTATNKLKRSKYFYINIYLRKNLKPGSV